MFLSTALKQAVRSLAFRALGRWLAYGFGATATRPCFFEVAMFDSVHRHQATPQARPNRGNRAARLDTSVGTVDLPAVGLTKVRLGRR